MSIGSLPAETGKMIKNDNSVVNIADVLSAEFNPDVGSFGQLPIDATTGGISLTPAVYGDCTKAFITVEVAQIRYRVDGGAPTSTVGHIADAGDVIELESREEIVNFKAIRTGSTSAVISATYSK